MGSNAVLRTSGMGAALACTAVFDLLATATMVAGVLLLSDVVARVLLSGAAPDDVRRSLVLLLVAVAARPLFVWLREATALRGAVGAKRRVRERLLDGLLTHGPAYRDGESTGELVTTAVEGVERLEAYFARYLPQAVSSALTPAIIALCVLWLDPLSGAVLLATGPAIPVLMVLIGRHAEEHMRLQWAALSRMGAHFLDVVRGLPTLKAFGRAGAERERVAGISEEFGRRTLAVLRVAFVSGLALEFIATVSVALVAVLLAVRLLFGDLPLAVALPVLLLAPEFYRPLRDLGASRHAGMEGKTAAERIAGILNAAPPVREPSGPPVPLRGPVTVEFSGVSFAYHGAAGEHSALSGVDLVLPAGTRTALVGPSGAGKTTLVDLLLRFRDPESGRILANGAPIEDLPADEWRQGVALVPQKPYLFYGTVLENLRLARPGAGREEVERAARLAGAQEFVRRLPQGYETPIGEGGVRLSEGEAQRLAIARAFLKDAPVLVLDEPASNLDPQNERLIEDALERLGEGRTVLVVAHRLGTARRADRIAVLESGHLAGLGTHDELVDGDGPYARLLGAAREEAGLMENGAPLETVASPPEPRQGGVGRPSPGRASDHDTREREAGRRRHLVRLLGFLKPHRGRVALAALLGTWTLAANVGLLAASAYLVSAAALKPPLSALIPAAILVQVLGTSRGASRYYERIFSHDVTFGLLASMRAWLYARLVPLSPARLVGSRGGDLLHRLVDDVDELQSVYLGVVAPLVAASAVSALAVALLGVFSASLALVALAFLVLAGVGVPLLLGILERGLGRRGVELEAALAAEIAEALGGARDLLALGRARDKGREISAVGRKLGRVQRRVALASGLREGLHELSVGLATWFVLSLAVPRVEEGGIGGVYLALVVLVTLASFEAVRPLGEAVQALGRSLVAGERVFETADSEPAVSNPEDPLQAPVGRTLELDGVAFRYGEDEPFVLDAVSFTLARGKKVAMVGPSGSGKSTLVGLLERFWDPTAGEVRLDGRDVRLYAQEEARAVLSVAAQDAYLFDATLRENLLLARATATDPELRSLLVRARLGGLVGHLPGGLDAVVGESGSRLSGGERRRLSVARASLRKAPFLVLDEPTADLDAETERRLLDEIHRTVDAEGRGLLLITHRLVGLDRMDEILVLVDGRIVERGTHEELLRANGPYRRMVGVQERMLAGR